MNGAKLIEQAFAFGDAWFIPGSTIALVNAAATGSPPATTYTYDPAGNPTVSGTANSWPFQYQGMEKELTDPGPLYYTGGGQYYKSTDHALAVETSQPLKNARERHRQ